MMKTKSSEPDDDAMMSRAAAMAIVRMLLRAISMFPALAAPPGAERQRLKEIAKAMLHVIREEIHALGDVKKN